MTSRADFHTHTNASDGRLTPSDLVRLAVSRGLSILSVTDHDSTEGIAEALAAAAQLPGFTLVPGIEMSTDIPGDEIHVLGYFLDYENPDFQTTLTSLRTARRDRGRMMVEKLHAHGNRHTLGARRGAGRRRLGGPAARRAGARRTRARLDLPGGVRPLHRQERPRLRRADEADAGGSNRNAGEGRRAAGARPSGKPVRTSTTCSLSSKAAGMVGVEVYYQDYDRNTCARLAAAAERHGLLKTGGSDFHGMGGERERLPGDIPLPDEAIDAFMAAGQRMTSGRLS